MFFKVILIILMSITWSILIIITLKIHLILVFFYRDVKANPDPVSVERGESIPRNLLGSTIYQDCMT